MAGRNDRRRAANLRSERSGGTRQGAATSARGSRSAATSRSSRARSASSTRGAEQKAETRRASRSGAESPSRGSRPTSQAGSERESHGSRATRSSRTTRTTRTGRTTRASRKANAASAARSRKARERIEEAQAAAAAEALEGEAGKPSAKQDDRMTVKPSVRGKIVKRFAKGKAGRGENGEEESIGEQPSSEEETLDVSEADAEGEKPDVDVDAESADDGEEGEASGRVVSTSVRALRRAERLERARQSSRRYFMRVITVVGIIVVLLAGWAALYNSPAFTITDVEVNGVEHLTGDEMSQLANVPSDTTLLRVDVDTIERRVEQNAWVADAEVVRAFPNTLRINVTERSVFAVVEIPTTSASTLKQWAISDDHIWLMPIPEADSEAAKTTSAKVYEDAQSVVHLVDIPIGTKAEIGSECVDANINNALNVLSGLTTQLGDSVAEISAAGTAETTLILDSGVEIAFGEAEDIRDKERVILEILDEHPNNVAYINVRMVETPTWRAV